MPIIELLLGPVLLYLALRESPPTRTEQKLLFGVFGVLSLYSGYSKLTGKGADDEVLQNTAATGLAVDVDPNQT